jgi:hypothetical protein
VLERPLEVLESRDLRRSSGFKRPSSAQARIKRPSRALESSVEISDGPVGAIGGLGGRGRRVFFVRAVLQGLGLSVAAAGAAVSAMSAAWVARCSWCAVVCMVRNRWRVSRSRSSVRRSSVAGVSDPRLPRWKPIPGKWQVGACGCGRSDASTGPRATARHRGVARQPLPKSSPQTRPPQPCHHTSACRPSPACSGLALPPA